MSYSDFLKEYNLEAPKKRSYNDSIQEIYTKKYNSIYNSANNLVKELNALSVTDYSKYGDYSSYKTKYEDISKKIGSLKHRLESLKSGINQKSYTEMMKYLNDINSGAGEGITNIGKITDFYSSFEDENQYKVWDTDRRLYAEHGDLTAENVDYYIRSMEKRKAKGELNGYEQEFYDWIKQYDLTHGYKDENYVNKRLEQLNRDLLEASKENGEHYDDYGRKWTMKSADYSEIEGRIGDLTQLRNNLNLDKAYVNKGYSLNKGAVGFKEKSAEYENSVTGEVNKPTSTKDVIKTKNIEDKVVFAYKNKEKYSRSFWKSDLGWLEYTGSNTVEADEIESWYKYSLLKPEEFSTYCYLAQNDKEKGTNSADKFLSDMEATLDMREAEELRKSRKADMNKEGFKGAFSTGLYNTLSVPASVLGGVQALPSAASSIIKGEDINIYSDSFTLSNFASDVRAITSEKIDSPAWNLVYNAVMSTADSLLAAYVFRDAAPYVLAASAATSRMKELVSQGASDLEIVVGSLASGAIEVITEKISIDRLFSGDIKPTKFKEWLAQGLIQSGVEGSEEIASEVLNNISDELLRGQMSDYNQKIRKYQADGLSKSEATKKASNEVLVNIMEALLSGMISGGIGGAVAGGSQMHKLNVIGSNIIKGDNVDSVLEAAEYLGKLDPEIAGQVKALKDFKDKATKGKSNKAYNRTLGKVAVTVAENASEVKHNIVESAVSNELKRRRVGADVINKVSKIVSKYIAGEKLSSSEQGYLKHNYVAATVMQEIKAAQEQIKAEAITSADAEISASTPSAPQWALDMVNSLSAVDSAVGIIKYAATGKTEEDEHQAEVNRMIKLLSIASGKTTAEQEAQAGDIPYEQYIKEKAEETAAQKENTAENSGDTSPMEDVDSENDAENGDKELSDREKVLNAFGITKLNDTLHVQKQVLETLDREGFWGNSEERSTTVVNSNSDMEVEINKKGIKETFNFDNFTKMPAQVKLRKLKTVFHIPEIIRKGNIRENVENYHNESSRIQYSYIDQVVNVDGDKFTVTIAVRISPQKNKFWVHQIDIKNSTEGPPAGTIESSKTGYTTHDTNDSIKENILYVKNEFSQNDNITHTDNFNGFSKVDVSEDNVTYESRLLHTMRGAKITTEGQAYIKRICRNLGIDVVFENVFTPKGNHADGYIDDNGVVHIDYHCSNPVEFVLKHELTHFGETSSLYKSFCKAVLSSDAFGEWISSKIEDGDTVILKTALMREQISELYKRNGVELSPAKQQNEMIANFVGEMLFSSDTNGLERLTANMTVKEKKSVIDYIKSFIAHIKDKLSMVKNVSSEILSLERKFNELISTADKSKLADEGGVVSYSIEEAEIFNPENKTMDELLEEILNNSVSNDGRYLYFGRFASDFVKTMYEKGVIIKELPILMNYRDVYLSMENKENGRYRGENVNYHNLGKEGIKSAIKQIQSPVAVMRSKNPKKLDLVLSFFDYKGRQCLTIVEVNTTVRNMEEFLSAHIVTSIYGKSNIERYIQKAKDEGRMLIDNRKELSQGISPVQYQSNINDNSSIDIIDDNSSSVNSNSMQESNGYSQENISENEEKTVKGNFSIPTATSEELDLDIETKKNNDYSYEALINKPDMEITTIDDSVEYSPTAENRKNIVNEAVKNAASVGRTNENGNAVVYVEDIDTEIIVPKRSMVHGLDRRFGVQAPVLVKIGEILKNSIQINELVPRSFDADNTYALISTANGGKGLYIISFIVNKFSNEVAQIDVLYSVNAKKESAALLPKFTDKSAPPTDSTISISDLLNLVNKYFPDILPEDVLRHYGHTSRPEGEIGKSALYSIDIEERGTAQLTDFPDLMAVLTDRRKRGEISEEDYMIEVRDLLDRANEKYGVIKQGELAENKMQLPKRVTEDKSAKTKRWVRTVHESGILPEDMEVQLEANILRDAMSYQIIDNATAQRQADTAIKRGTAENEWNAVVNGTGRIGKREIAIGETLLKLAAERKDSKTVMKLIAEVSEVGTRAGQVVQAMSMLKRMDGIGQLYYVKKTVDKINRDLDKRYGRRLKKGKIAEIPQVKINETLAEQLAASKTQEDFDITYEAMIKEIAEQLPSTFLDKWNAWRYFAMLFNPRTHIRNILGNYGFVPAVRTKDVLAAAIERVFLDESKYTKTAIVKKEYREFALKDFAEAENIITGSGKMNPSDEIRDKQAIFDTKWLEKLRKWNFDTLEKEDAMFLKKHYSHALGGFLQARNIDITKEIDSSVMEEARKYAIMEAQKATYRDSSAIVNVLQRTSHTKSQVWNSIVEGVLPFKKTPINIVRRGIEYSPIGLIKTLTKGTYDLVNGDITASQFIDGIAGGLTGTGIVVLGALLTSLGFINVTGGFDDDEEDDINRLLGRQEYAVEILGHSYTIDWMAPACIPFFIGVEIQNALEEKGNANLFQSIKNVTGSALEPIINLSMLSGMQDILSSARYSDGAAVVSSVLWNIALSYGSQALPSLSGAVARTIDGKRRTTYIDRNSWISDMGQMALNKIESKIPFATKLRSEYVDEFGRTEDNGNVFVRAIQNFISPGYYSKIEDDPVLEELKELYEQTGESVLPTKPKKYINVNGENKHLTADEYEEYAAEVGQERYDYVKELFGSSQAKTLSYEEKRKVISDLYSYALAKGKTHYSDYKLPDLYEKAYEAEKNGISPVDYYLSKIATNVENADTDGSGTVTKNERLAAIYKMNVSNDIKAALIALYS